MFLELITGGAVVGNLLSRYESGHRAGNGKAEQSATFHQHIVAYVCDEVG